MPDEKSNQEVDEQVVNPARAVDLVEPAMQRLLDHADVKHVFGKPLQQGEITIIPAAEVTIMGGFGAGFGVGVGMQEGPTEGEGGGGGGGAKTLARPVAVVIISPEGVRVEPVIDLTKIGLAVITAWGFMLSIIMRMRRPRKA